MLESSSGKKQSSGWLKAQRDYRSNHAELIAYVLISGTLFAISAFAFSNLVFIALMGAIFLISVLRLALRW